MKNLKFILVLAISSVMAISCGSDDDGGPAEPTLTNELLAGTYDLNFFESSVVLVTTLDAGSVTTTTTQEGDTFGSSNIVFNVDGTYTQTFQYVVTEVVTFADNDPVESTFIENSTNVSVTGSYSVNDDDQTLTMDGELYDVEQFNGTSLRIEFFDMVTSGDEEITTERELRFTRQ